MEKLSTSKISLILHLILYLQLCFLVLSSSAYTLPNKYFINCGSDSTTSTGSDRNFVGDRPYLVRPGKAFEVSNSSASSTELYQTARVFHKGLSSYRFQIDKQGTYIIRLHFLIFSTPDANLSKAKFNVHATQFQLLSDFYISSQNLPVIKEFLLTINKGIFNIDFIPSDRSSLAFVNAIEVFPAPEGFIPGNTFEITTAGKTGNYSTILSRALYTVHRINVGGSMITEINDSLWRTWIPDDKFLYNSEAATNAPYFDSYLMRSQASEYIAPDPVYKTAKVLDSNFSNISWGFEVSKNSKHLVRVHFCDITSSDLDKLKFSFRIYRKFSRNISQYDNGGGQNAAPFYFDFIVDSDSSGLINVSVHQKNDSEIKNAYLNGLEIMEILNKTLPDAVHKKIAQPVIGGSLAAAVFLLVVIVGLLVILKFRRAKTSRNWRMPFSMPLYGGSSHYWSDDKTSSLFLASDLNLELKRPYSEIQKATKDFSKKMLIGEGGFGKVYKAILREGVKEVKVAVKRSEPGHGQGISEFQNEITVLCEIRNRHLVRLIGYCAERSEMILIYEFMEKGTLREHLYISDDSSEKYTSKSELTWEQRLKICIDSAEGLHYLHSGLANRIIHRDVKSTNILLNEDYRAKVADFGLSKLGPVEPDENTGVKGSFGYLDPEYMMSLQLTEKSDVYSFGVVLLEVLCARPVIITTDRHEEINLADWGMHWQRKGQLEEIIDPCLKGTTSSDSLRVVGKTAEKCLRLKGADRPMMQEVLWDLKFALQLQQTSANREEDSMINAPLEFPLQDFQHLPSSRAPFEGNNSFAGGDDSSVSMASGVFSEIKIEDGR